MVCPHFQSLFDSVHFCIADADREKLAASNGKFAQYLCKILDVYYSYHYEAYNIKGMSIWFLLSRRNAFISSVMMLLGYNTGVYLHDPTAMLAAIDPSLVTCTEGVVRVQTNGITRGLTILHNQQKRYVVKKHKET